jgi:hypothetical protein
MLAKHFGGMLAGLTSVSHFRPGSKSGPSFFMPSFSRSEYLASVKLSSQSTHGFELKTFPRPAGRATRVIITEYDLPRKEIQPHDVIVDPDSRSGARISASSSFRPSRPARSPHRRMDELSPAVLRQHSPGVRRRPTPVTVGIGNNLGAAVIKCEPLE